MKLGELLVSQNKVTNRDIERAFLAQSEMGGLFGQVLVKLGLVSELDVAHALSEQLSTPFLTESGYPESPLFIEGLSYEFLVSNHVVPVDVERKPLLFSAAIPQDIYLSKALSLVLGEPVEIQLGLEVDIATALKKHTEEEESEADEELLDDHFEGDEEFVEHLKDLASGAPVIRLVNQIIHRAVDMGASDIHIEPFEEGLFLRYRVDGVIQDMPDPPAPSLSAAIASRIKLLASMNIAERRLPQDGRIMIRVKGHELDLRVSTIPTVHGESIVMRVLDRKNIQLSLESMGFSADTLKHYLELLHRPHGVLLVTGPTGSGKTTTLYASLATLDARGVKIVTIEDPVEYQLGGINQVQVQSQIDFSFARALRSILRQDPDVIMVGEMRDEETAKIAVQSALTGHLVLSTLHTNTASGAIIRLEDMGVERYLVTSAVTGVLAQRLVRTLCVKCKKAVELNEEAIEHNGLKRFLPEGQTKIYAAKGCEACRQTGYQGRTAIHELFEMDEEMQKAILRGDDGMALHRTARSRGMITLYEDGLRKVVSGAVSLEELLRVTQEQSEEDQQVVLDA